MEPQHGGGFKIKKKYISKRRTQGRAYTYSLQLFIDLIIEYEEGNIGVILTIYFAFLILLMMPIHFENI